ncbi:MAG: (2Fe-2S) ferredoxin domain-containing protein, partial [bacterium]|nr:(2Fe-2S) ferredoxin domain-containing protein [bacterium]
MKEIKVGLATCGIAAGGGAVYEEFKKEIKANDLNVNLKETGCMGMCYAEVLVEVVDGSGSHLYSKVTPDMVNQIVRKHLLGN